jgi:hypothetical protein
MSGKVVMGLIEALRATFVVSDRAGWTVQNASLAVLDGKRTGDWRKLNGLGEASVHGRITSTPPSSRCDLNRSGMRRNVETQATALLFH